MLQFGELQIDPSSNSAPLDGHCKAILCWQLGELQVGSKLQHCPLHLQHKAMLCWRVGELLFHALTKPSVSALVLVDMSFSSILISFTSFPATTVGTSIFGICVGATGLLSRSIQITTQAQYGKVIRR